MPIFFTDGSCRAKTRLGGWGYVRVLEDGTALRYGYAAYSDTTVNRMELMAVIRAIESVRGKNKRIRIFTDSKVTILGCRRVLQGLAKFDKIANGDLFLRFRNAAAGQRIELTHVKGHTGIHFNEVADKLAGRGYIEAKQGLNTVISDTKRDAPEEGRPLKTMFAA